VNGRSDRALRPSQIGFYPGARIVGALVHRLRRRVGGLGCAATHAPACGQGDAIVE